MFLRFITIIFSLLVISACTTTGNNTKSTGSASTNATASKYNVESSSLEPFSKIAGSKTNARAHDRVFFDFDQSTLSKTAQSTLDKQAAYLKKNPTINVMVEGHCDERGTREYNLALGARRADAVRKYLVSSGVQSSRITTVSYGKERPAVLGSNSAAYAENRRGVTVIK